jgi:hypothetical protein
MGKSCFAPRNIGRGIVVSVVAVLSGCGGQTPRTQSMSHPRSDGSPATARFHHIVEKGTLEDLQAALEKGIDVDAPGRTGQTALMVAIAAKDLEKMKLLIRYGADPELADQLNGTALRHAVQWDFAAGVRYLLDLGVDRGFHPKYPLKTINYDYQLPEPTVPDELKEIMSGPEWKEAMEETRRSITDLGRNPTVEPMIADVQSVEVLKQFLDVGDELDLAPTDVKRRYMGLGNGGDFRSTPDDYKQNKSPRYGMVNPERMDNPFWRDMIALGVDAYAAREKFNDTDVFRTPGAVWCFSRFGASVTELDDGRFVQIGGEHEDFYDPDFCIYNDVVVHDGTGNFEVYGYPKVVFPPTDFHTATLVGDWIYIIGCLGYPDQRDERRIPVYRLKLKTWEIERVNSSGDIPGWLHRHRSKYDPKNNAIHVEGGTLQITTGEENVDLVPNKSHFTFDVSSGTWRRLK